MKLALLQLNPTVGDLEGNAARILAQAQTAALQNPDLMITSELALLGYPPRDLLLNRGFMQRAWQVLADLAQKLVGLPPVLVGIAEHNPASQGRPLFNSAVLLDQGKLGPTLRKTLLPTYDVFDEDRYFEPAKEAQLLNIRGLSIGVSICEDLWNDRDFWQRQRYHQDPVAALAHQGAQCLINLSASPFTVGKQALREAMLSQLARKHQLPVVYVNQVGGNDDLVFDGQSMVLDAQGRILARAKAFAEEALVVDLAQPSMDVPAEDRQSELWQCLVLGTHDYVQKCGFKKVLLGLSGGVDSALTATIAAEALGPENVLGVLMPSPYSSPSSISDSLHLAKNLGMETLTLPIASLMEAFAATLAEPFAGRAPDVTEENIQSRIRGNLLMALSNKFGSMLLTTGNKSELAVGYCTIYGDMSGGLAVISDLPKTWVYRLCQWLNRDEEKIPWNILEKPPSAELRPDQKDQDSLPPYDLLDELLYHHIERHEGAEELIASGFDPATVKKVLRLVQIAEFKRRQAPPGLKVTDRAFGSGWRMPIARK
jgi:NAD+ synthase (glutamine-hydrolysing)